MQIQIKNKKQNKQKVKHSHSLILRRRCFSVVVLYLQSSKPYVTDKTFQNREQLQIPQLTAVKNEDFLMKNWNLEQNIRGNLCF